MDGDRNTDANHGSCSHTNHDDPLPWFVVDLGKDYNISRVNITNREDWPGEKSKEYKHMLLSGFSLVFVSWRQ